MYRQVNGQPLCDLCPCIHPVHFFAVLVNFVLAQHLAPERMRLEQLEDGVKSHPSFSQGVAGSSQDGTEMYRK